MPRTYPILFPADTRFFFVVGCMKSGSTWLMNALDAHPEICCQGEMHPVEVLDAATPQFLPTLESVSAHSESLRRWHAAPNSAWNVPFRESKKARVQMDQQLDLDFVRFFFEWTAREYVDAKEMPAPKAIGDKSPSHTHLIAKKLARYFGPYRPYLIHLVRDPRDVALSRWFHARRQQYKGQFEYVPAFQSADDEASCKLLHEDPEKFRSTGARLFLYDRFLEHTFREWNAVNTTLLEQGPTFFGSRYLVVRYEDLKQDFAGVMETILGRMGLDRSPASIQFMQDRTDPKKNSHHAPVLRSGRSGEWKTWFQPEDLSVFRSVAQPVCAGFGYE